MKTCLDKINDIMDVFDNGLKESFKTNHLHVKTALALSGFAISTFFAPQLVLFGAAVGFSIGCISRCTVNLYAVNWNFTRPHDAFLSMVVGLSTSCISQSFGILAGLHMGVFACKKCFPIFYY